MRPKNIAGVNHATLFHHLFTKLTARRHVGAKATKIRASANKSTTTLTSTPRESRTLLRTHRFALSALHGDRCHTKFSQSQAKAKAKAKTEGLAAQNRNNVAHFATHLRGKIAYIALIDPTKGAKLMAEFAKLATPAST